MFGVALVIDLVLFYTAKMNIYSFHDKKSLEDLAQ